MINFTFTHYKMTFSLVFFIYHSLGNISEIESSKVALESRQSMIYENLIHLYLDKMQYVENFNKSLISVNHLYIPYKHRIKFKVLSKCSK